MTEQDDLLARERIDGGFSFALAALAIGLGLIAVLERVGLPDRVLSFCVGALVFSGFLITAALLRTMRPADFYAGGRMLPVPYAGLAYAGLAAGLFLPFLPPLPQGIALKSLVAGFGAGFLVLVFLTGPYLRRHAAFSIADLAATRFPNPVARWAIAAIAAICAGLVAIAGYASALDVFLHLTEADHAVGVAVVGVLLVILIVPGGLSGVIWLAVGAAVVTLVALALPALLMFREAVPWAAARARFDVLTGVQPNLPLEPSVVIVLALGLAALAPLFGPAVASRSRSSALRSGPLALFFVGTIAVLAALTMARASLALDAAVVGHELGRSPAAYLLQNLPVLRKEGAMLAGLAGVFAMALGIGVAAAGVQSFVTSIGHDLFDQKRRRFGLASRRLAYARALAILLIAACGTALSLEPIDPRPFIALALAISAMLMAPVLALTLVRRATSIDALAALLVGTLVMAVFILTRRRIFVPGELATNVIFAAIDAFLAGIILSFLHGRPAARQTLALPEDEPPGPD